MLSPTLLRALLLALAGLAPLIAHAQVRPLIPSRAHSLSVSVLTCDAGDDIPTAYGHVAIRLRDTSTYHPLDIVFDYGTFNYGDPLFLLKFGRGTLLYYLSVRSFEQFYDEYAGEQRRVTEQRLMLTELQRQRIAELLFSNYQPENRYYLYDFITDNCATRIRDLLEHPDFTHPLIGPDSTYRQLIHHYLLHRPWLGLAIDMLLGPSTDEKASFGQSLFLPYTLANGLAHYRNQTNGQPLAEPAQVLIEGRTAQHHWAIAEPWVAFWLLFALTAWLMLRQRLRALRYMTIVAFGLVSLIGAVLLFLWVGSRYSCTNMNLNLLWCAPLYPLLLLPLSAATKRVLLLLSGTMLTAVLLMGWWGMPQQFNAAVYPISATLLLLIYNKLRQLPAPK